VIVRSFHNYMIAVNWGGEDTPARIPNRSGAKIRTDGRIRGGMAPKKEFFVGLRIRFC
jgi:hypothetical protein